MKLIDLVKESMQPGCKHCSTEALENNGGILIFCQLHAKLKPASGYKYFAVYVSPCTSDDWSNCPLNESP